MGAASASNQHSNQTTVNSLDPNTTHWTQEAMDAARAAGNAGPSPLVTGASNYGTAMQNTGNLGMGALSGDPNAVQTLMNPYQRQVMDAMNAQFDRSGLLAVRGANQNATASGAYGGSRSGVQAGTAQAANELNRNSQVGGLLYGGYGDAMSRAQAMAGMGAQGAAMNANLGMGGVGSPDQWMSEMLTRYGRGNPYGTSQGTTGNTWNVNTHASYGMPGMTG